MGRGGPLPGAGAGGAGEPQAQQQPTAQEATQAAGEAPAPAAGEPLDAAPPQAAAPPLAEPGPEGGERPSGAEGCGEGGGGGPAARGEGEGGGAEVKEEPRAEVKEEPRADVKEEPPEANPEDSDIMEIGYDDDDDGLELLGGEEALAEVKAKVEAAAAKAAAREKKKAKEAAAKKLRKLEEAAAKERKRVEEERRRAEERAQREEAARLEAQHRAAQEAAGREALRQREAELRERRGAELREAQLQLRRREAEKAAMLQAAQRELLQREAERERAKKKAVGNVKFDEAGSFSNFGSFNAKRSLAEAHGQSDKKAGSTDESSNDSEDSQEASEQEGQARRNPTKFRPPSLWTDPSAALQDDAQQVDWDNSPEDLLPREKVPTAAAFVEHFARFTIGAWRQELRKPIPFEGKDLQETELAVFKSRQSLQQIEGAVGPLIKQLARNEANEEVVKQLDTMVTLAAEREYAEAGAAYITMALGHKKWNQTHATYAGAVGQNKGCRTYKTYQDKLLEYDKDPVVQKYIQCMRKLVHFAQCIRPNDDVAKHLHI